MAVRQCTEHYKLRPIERAIRAHMGITRLSDRNRADIYLGITTDEIARVRPNRNPYLTNRYPLLDAGWSRADCAKWLSDHYPEVPCRKVRLRDLPVSFGRRMGAPAVGRPRQGSGGRSP